MRWWIDIANAPNVTLFRPLAKALLDRGNDVWVTTWDRGQAAVLALDEWPDATVIGRHGFRRPVLSKGFSIAERAGQLRQFGHRIRADVALGHGSNSLVLAARLLRVPAINMMDYEHHPGNHLGFRLANRVVLPEAIGLDAVRQYGLSRRRAVFYPGIKEDIALAEFQPNPGFRRDLGLPEDAVVALVRPAAEGALYHRGPNTILDAVIDRLLAWQITVLLSPRTKGQAFHYATEGPQGVRAVEAPLSGPDLCFHADVMIGAGGSMTREAAVLGVPTYSVFQGKPAAVDKWLAEQGRLSFLTEPDQLARPVRRGTSHDPRPLAAAPITRYVDLLEDQARQLRRSRAIGR